jgi:hypothetical protein
MKTWPLTHVAAKPPSAASEKSEIQNTGAPLKYDWARLGAYFAFYTAEHDLPQKADLTKLALEFFKERGKVPKDTRDVERFVSVFWDYYLQLRKQKTRPPDG